MGDVCFGLAAAYRCWQDTSTSVTAFGGGMAAVFRTTWFRRDSAFSGETILAINHLFSDPSAHSALIREIGLTKLRL